MIINDPPKFKRNEKMLIRFGFLGWVAAICFQISACQTDPAPTALLQMTVLLEVDESPAKNAKIVLYQNLSDWQNETNPINSPAITNSQGNFIFGQLPYNKVYIDIKNADLSHDNWDSRIELSLTTARFGFNNRSYSVLKPSFLGRFASAKGKEWKLSKILQNGRDITQEYELCLRDNILISKKDKSITLYQGQQKCSSSEPDSLSGFWDFQSQRLTFVFKNASKEYEVFYFTNDSLVLKDEWRNEKINLCYSSR